MSVRGQATGRSTTARRPAILLALALVATLVPLVALSPIEPAGALPAGFSEQTVLSGFGEPMAVEFSDDGRVFVAEKSGIINVFDGLGDTTPSVFADLRTKVYNGYDRGLMSLTLHPEFPDQPWVYVLYAHDAVIGGAAPRWGSPGDTFDNCPGPPGATEDGCVISGRLSRLSAAGATAGPEQVLVEDWCQQYPSHSLGDLAFGPDGYLYASGGDGASYNWADYGQSGIPLNPCGDPPTGVGGNQTVPNAEGGALRSQDVQTTGDPMGLDGSVIRIDPVTGAGAPGNPAITSSDPNMRRVVATGLRNPFRMSFRPGTSELYIGDVGWTTWEEINRLSNPTDSTIDNFGWPCKENTGTNGYDIGLNLCERILDGIVPTVNPHYAYRHGQAVVSGDGCPTNSGSSTSGIAFYEGGTYPAAYDGAMFFADYSRRCIWVMFPGAGGAPDPATRTLFRQSSAFPVDLETGPNGDLYYVDIAMGEVRRIRYTSGNQPPIAAISASPTQGPLPLTVSFSATGSSDPEGGALTYAWDLDGDGDFDDANGPTASRTYTVAGAVDAAVRVSEPGGLTDVATRRIQPGSASPVPTISTPAIGFQWTARQNITFSGSATDPEDGPLPASALSWRAIMHHCITIDGCHEHPISSFTGVTSGSFEAPEHDYPSYIELELTATDSTGVESTVSRRLDPRVSQITIESDPTGLAASLSAQTGDTPMVIQAIVGSRLTLSTAATQNIGPNSYAFTGWSDGGARAHEIVVPAADVTYRATFTRLSGGDESLLAAYSFDEGNGTSLADRTGKGHTGSISGATWSAAGRTGGALSFDGVNDLVTIADANDLDLTEDLTMEAWVRPTAVNDWRTLLLKESGAGLSYGLYSSGPGAPSGYARINNGDRDVTAPSGLPANTWSHLTMTYDGTTLRLYVNGSQVASTDQVGPITTSTSPLRMGGNTIWGEYFAGAIDDVRIYNRTLSVPEIVADRDTPVAGDTVAPTAPTGVTATGGQGSASLAWTAATDNVGVAFYDVHRSTSSGFTPTPLNRVTTVTGTSHADSGLAPGTYYYRVIARDAAGNTSPVSAQASAVVTGDITAPTVSVTAPAAGATVSGPVSISATASDAGGIAGVQLRVDGQPVGAEDTSAPYTVSWNTNTATNGSHSITAVARDVAGNTATSAARSVTVANDTVAPTVSVTSPSGGATVSGTVSVAATAADDTSVAGVQLRVDGQALGAEDTSAPYTGSWNTTTVPNGSHTITAVARDPSGNTATSAPVAVTVQNTGPQPGAPVASYSFDEGGGSTLFDRSGHGHDGAVSGATWSATGHSAGALSFDGVNDLVSVADEAGLDLTSALTIEGWVRPTAPGGWQSLVLKERGADGLTYGLYASGLDDPSAYIRVANNDPAVVGADPLAANTWSHLAVTYDGANMRLFINGAQVASRAQTGAIVPSTGALRIGGNVIWGEWFGGLIDDVRIYNRALSAAEVATDRDTAVAGDEVVPSIPTGLTATGGQGSAQLSWTASTDNVAVTGYDIHRSTTAGFTISASTRVGTSTSTSFNDAGLLPGTYHYRVVARDGAQNASGPSNQATATVTGDTTAPVVSISAPANGATVSGTVNVTATATDAGGVAGVQLRLDGQPLGAEDTAAPYTVSWNTTGVANGTHTLTAVARDAAGNTTTSATVTVTVQNSATPPPGGLVASYSFDEGAGGTLADRTGKGHTGTISGATWSTAGHTGGALSFDGSNDMVTIADAADLDLTNAMTLEAWVRPTAATGWRTVLLKERGADGLSYSLYANGEPARPSAYIRVSNADRDATGTATLPANTWAHVAMTFDGFNLRLYVNGTQVATRVVSGSAVTSNNPLRMGGSAVYGEFFAGLIDDVRIYGRALTPAEIAANRNTPVG